VRIKQCAVRRIERIITNVTETSAGDKSVELQWRGSISKGQSSCSSSGDAAKAVEGHCASSEWR